MIELQEKYGDTGDFVEIFDEEPKNGTFHAIRKDSCYNCGGGLIVDGYFATGEELPSGYTPEPGELVKNNIMKCEDCGDWQVS